MKVITLISLIALVLSCKSRPNSAISALSNEKINSINSHHKQTFADDWKNFKNEDFNIAIILSQSEMWDKTSHGQLTFENKKDKSIVLKFHAFLIEDTDSIFFQTIQDWYIKQSCASMGELFRPFNHKAYYYYLEPCNRCNTTFHKDCADLLNQLKHFATAYPK